MYELLFWIYLILKSKFGMDLNFGFLEPLISNMFDLNHWIFILFIISIKVWFLMKWGNFGLLDLLGLWFGPLDQEFRIYYDFIWFYLIWDLKLNCDLCEFQKIMKFWQEIYHLEIWILKFILVQNDLWIVRNEFLKYFILKIV